MKILLLTTHLNAGGITSYLLTLARGLIQSGVEVHLAASSGDQSDEFLKLGVKFFEVDVKTKSEIHPKLFSARRMTQQYVNAHQIDVLHAQTRVTQVLAQKVAKGTGAAYVSTCHGFFRPRWHRKAFGAWGDAVIAISPQVAKHLEDDFHVDPSKVVLMTSGIDLRCFEPLTDNERIEKRRELGFFTEPLVGLIARLSDVKGQDLLVQAFTRVVEAVPEAKLLLIGEGKEEAGLKALVNDLKLQDSVHFLPISGEIREMYGVLDVFAMPSRNEGLGLSMMEAQAMGLACVGADVGGLSGLIEEGVTGLLIPKENVERLAEKIVALLSNYDLRQRLSLNARAKAVEHYSSARVIPQMIELYQSVIK